MTQIFGLGNAIVDVEVNVEDSFLADQDLPKGQMTLVDSQQVSALTAALDGASMQRYSGGSAANTIFAAQGFGLQTSYTCKVADDINGRYFLDEMGAAGIELNPSCLSTEVGASSGQCLVMISADAERTMCTDLGISATLAAGDRDERHRTVLETRSRQRTSHRQSFGTLVHALVRAIPGEKNTTRGLKIQVSSSCRPAWTPACTA